MTQKESAVNLLSILLSWKFEWACKSIGTIVRMHSFWKTRIISFKTSASKSIEQCHHNILAEKIESTNLLIFSELHLSKDHHYKYANGSFNENTASVLKSDSPVETTRKLNGPLHILFRLKTGPTIYSMVLIY